MESRYMDEFQDWKRGQALAWLKHIGDLVRDEATIDGTMEALRRIAEPSGIDYTKPVISKSVDVDVMTEVYCAMEEIAQEWRDRKIEIQAERNEARRTIFKVEDSRYRQLLILRYVDGNDWKSIARKMSYSEDNCYKLHDRAALALYDFLPPEWRTEIPKALQ